MSYCVDLVYTLCTHENWICNQSLLTSHINTEGHVGHTGALKTLSSKWPYYKYRACYRRMLMPKCSWARKGLTRESSCQCEDRRLTLDSGGTPRDYSTVFISVFVCPVLTSTPTHTYPHLDQFPPFVVISSPVFVSSCTSPARPPSNRTHSAGIFGGGQIDPSDSKRERAKSSCYSQLLDLVSPTSWAGTHWVCSEKVGPKGCCGFTAVVG